ncbi:hypothetical protein B0H17DRAFT_1126717 [Mycena rosella]|uniref:Uncharacterized protein n=1 Tax=Mycena rosella TaxID=1033263 RepID=A0AAD7GSL6_MYCRO|nr:hypothetical protein B0H17DRAFT_1126717 [Mycena rosella]
MEATTILDVQFRLLPSDDEVPSLGVPYYLKDPLHSSMPLLTQMQTSWDYHARPQRDTPLGYSATEVESWGNVVPVLSFQFNLVVQRLLAFRSTGDGQSTMVFLGLEPRLEATRFYIYDAPTKNIFEGDIASTVLIGSAEFINAVDWNKMKHLGFLAADTDVVLRHQNIPGPPLFARGNHESLWGFKPQKTRDTPNAAA